MNKEYLISAAGGNITVIRTIDSPQPTEWYASEGRYLVDKYEEKGAEQSGFFIPNSKHLEMSGGEFCGNATRAAAILASDFGKEPEVEHTVSGYDGSVISKVKNIGNYRRGDYWYKVQSKFADMTIKTTRGPVSYDGYDGEADIVDLDGIIHIVVDAMLPASYEEVHNKLCKDHNLRNRPAVGVVWMEHIEDGIKIHPVVWVKGSNTFYYETSCGSGTIAASKVTSSSTITQVTGQDISVNFSENEVILSSEMEVRLYDNLLRQSSKVSQV